MKIYAIRDRMIDYYQTPFVAPGDKEVFAMVANLVNSEDKQNAITQAPHHFEIWRIGEVQEETGSLTAGREFLADCSQLVRAGRQPTERPSGPPNGPEALRETVSGIAPGVAKAVREALPEHQNAADLKAPHNGAEPN